MNRLLTLALGCALIGAAAACGGDGGSSKTPAFPTPIGTAVVPVPGFKTPTSAESTVIAADYALELYRHDAVPRTQGTDVIDFPYDVLLPKGWQIDSSGVGLTVSLLAPNNFPYVGVSVDCRPGLSAISMLAKDGSSAEALGLGSLGSEPQAAYTVAGQAAIRVDWAGGTAFPANHISIYVDGKSCAWRLQLNTFGAIRTSQFEAFFLKIVDAFDPAQGLP